MTIDYREAALLGPSYTFKNSDFPVGTPVAITYALPASAPVDWPESSFRSLADSAVASYRSLVMQALSVVEATCGVEFVATPASGAQIRFGIASIASPGVGGYALTQYDSTQNLYVTDVVYDDTLSSAGNFKSAILHEIGHALGLKHPGDYGTGDTGPFLPAAEDNTGNTIMSYHLTAPDTLAFGPYDIETLQYLYGTPIAAGAYVGQESGASARTGTAGNDLFALNSYELWSHDNSTSFIDNGTGYRASAIGIAIDGGGGVDKVDIPVARSLCSLKEVAGHLYVTTQWSVTLNGGSTGTLSLEDRLDNIERLHFADGTSLALDTDGAAGEAYGLLYAALGAAPADSLVGTWLQRFDAGLTGAQVATEILDTYVPGLSATTLVDALYLHLTGVMPTPAQEASLVGLIGSGSGQYTPGEFYAAAAALDLNHAHYAALIANGISYA